MSAERSSPLLGALALSTVRERTGVVIPVYLPEGIDVGQGEVLLADTVEAYCAQISDPRGICLSVDGAGCGATAAQRLAGKYGTLLHVAPVNRGKLSAAANGVRGLVRERDPEYLAVVDQDGDHFANELPNLVRAAQHIAGVTGDDRVLVIGQRSSRHRPMGFLRGELEEFADRVLLDALSYHAALAGRPLRLEYVLTLGEFPDFHSGYKLFSRSTAEHIFLAEPHLEGVPEVCYYRHACEAVMAVEAILSGAYLGAVNRSTFNEQPITTFGLYDLSQLVADKIIWPCKRLHIPVDFARQWMANHAPRLLLQTLAPAGKEELERVIGLVLASLGEEPPRSEPPPLRPLFV